MANRMDIELTSARDDDTYTWRAAGARQPRGVVPISVLPPHSKVGDVLRAEVEVELDGITVLSVIPPKEKHEDTTNRIEHLGPPRSAPGVTTVLAGRPERRGGFGREGERRGPRGADQRAGRGERTPRRRDGERSGDAAGRSTVAGGRRDGSRRFEGGDRTRGEERPPRATASGDARAPHGRPARDAGGAGGEPGSGKPGRRMPPRFEPGTAHRNRLFETLTPEQRAIAERLAAGGLPALRKALTDEQQRAKEEGRPIASGEPIIAIAEELLGDVKAAVWLDRAEAALEKADEITLRDLRATVVGAAPRDEAGRELERNLRETLDRRVRKLRQDWEQHLTQALGDGRVLQALRLSAKPPEPTARFPAALVKPLAEAAGQAMTEETTPERWLSLLEAAVQSPVRRQVKPVGLPKDPDGGVERQARAAASRIPALGRLLGMAIPPPPHPAARPPARPPRRPEPQAERAAEPVAEPVAEPSPEEPASILLAPAPSPEVDPVVTEEVRQTGDEG